MGSMPPPRIVLVMPDQWPRALLRAALREVGYDASGTRGLSGAFHQAAPDPSRGPLGLLLVDQDSLTEDGESYARQLKECAASVPIILLAPATRPTRKGPWTRVIRRPTSIADLVQLVESVVPLAPGDRRPID
jgi:hypothetical protein